MIRVLPLKQRLIFRNLDNSVVKELSLKEIIKDYSQLLQSKSDKLKNEIKNLLRNSSSLKHDPLLYRKFTLSKTAQNCLSFITKKEEKSFYEKGLEDERIVSIIRIIYILLDEINESEDFTREILIENLIDKIYRDLKVDSLSKNINI